jgi:biotin operon repressor
VNSDRGYIKLYRSYIDWEWFSDYKTAHLWTYLLCRAQWEDTRWRGIQIRRGQLLESLPSIASKTGMSVRSVRTALNHLKSTGEVTDEVTGFGRLITIVKYAEYQGQDTEGDRLSDRIPDRELTVYRQGSDREPTAYKEVKEVKNYKKNKEERAAPTLDEVKQFVKEEGLTIDPARFFNFYESQDWKTSSGYPIRDWKSKARSWQSSERPKRKEELPDFYNPDPVRDPEPKLATKEEIERVKALLNKGRKTK